MSKEKSVIETLIMDNYQLRAKIFPSILSSIPALIFQYFFINIEVTNFLQFLGNLNFIGNITISMIIIYFISEGNRFIAKTKFEKEEIYMPTTEFLLFSNSEYSPEYKRKIYEKIEKDFNIKLPTETEQKDAELNSRKRLAEGMSLARKRIGPGKLLLKHNIQYGFWRNLIGGTFFAIIFSILDMYFAFIQSVKIIFILSAIFLIICFMLLIFNQYIIQKAGKFYARVLIQEYMEGSN